MLTLYKFSPVIPRKVSSNESKVVRQRRVRDTITVHQESPASREQPLPLISHGAVVDFVFEDYKQYLLELAVAVAVDGLLVCVIVASLGRCNLFGGPLID